jgi:hypothetical protein
MAILKRFIVLTLVSLVFLQGRSIHSQTMQQFPAFGRDTVLVYKAVNDSSELGTLVVRIAQFAPDRYFEWEDSSGQGTVFLAANTLASSKIFLMRRLFQSGVDTRSKDSTTLWLSEKSYQDLKLKQKIKLAIDALEEWVKLDGSDQITLEVNQTQQILPVIKISNSRGLTFWFLDSAENPLQVKLTVRNYVETLVSITTDRPNTLRWIKGKKLINPH